MGAYWLWPAARCSATSARSRYGGSKSGNPWPRLIAPVSAASRDITVKIVVPTPGSFDAANQKLLAEIVWPHFWAIQIILFVLIAMYCTVHELVRVIGKKKVMRIFFGPMPVPEV